MPDTFPRGIWSSFGKERSWLCHSISRGMRSPASLSPPSPTSCRHSICTALDYNTAAGQFSISDSGWLVYAEGGILPDMQNSLVWVDQKGRAEPIASFKAPFFAPRLSPDGQRIAYTTLGREERVWVYDLNRGTASRLTGEGKACFVTWTPDGKRVVFGWSKSGQPNLYWQPADGSSAMERLTTSDYCAMRQDHGLLTEPLSPLSKDTQTPAGTYFCWICGAVA